MPTTTEILSKYNEIYPKVESLVTEQARLYVRGLEDLERLYGDWDITGTEKARLVAQYVVSATTALISGSQQMALSLLEQAYTIPTEIARKEAETATHTKQLELMQAQIENVTADSLLKAAQAEDLQSRKLLTDIRRQAGAAEVQLQIARVRTEMKEACLREAQIQKEIKDAELVEIQSQMLSEGAILSTLITLSQYLSEMTGNMAFGGVPVPLSAQAVNREAMLATLREINRSATVAGREPVFKQEDLDAIDRFN